MPRPPTDSECIYCSTGFLQGFAEQYWEDHLRQQADRAAGPPTDDLPDPSAKTMNAETTSTDQSTDQSAPSAIHIGIHDVLEPERPGHYDWWADRRNYSGPVIDVLDELKERGIVRLIGLGGTTAAGADGGGERHIFLGAVTRIRGGVKSPVFL